VEWKGKMNSRKDAGDEERRRAAKEKEGR